MNALSNVIPGGLKIVLDNSDFSGPASEGTVEELESRLGFSFPEQYKAFLLNYGAALFQGFEIFGIAEDEDEEGPPLWSDVRSELFSSDLSEFPGRLIPISNDGSDYTFYILVKQNSESGDQPVVAYGPGVDGKEVADSFFDFIKVAQQDGIETLVR